MCGIAGIAGAGDPRQIEQTVRGMLAGLRHRGPDGEGIFSAPAVALGHRRLAILDLSQAGAQPMRSRDGRWVIVLNGEIFNYREIAATLPGPFRSATDTEVLLEACAAWGVEKTLDRLIGMFAFALWDGRERELILARDRFGEKPLVYFEHRETFGFASEMKALAPLSERRLDPAGVDAYLGLGYIPAPWSIFRDCHKLPAGHLVRYRAGKAELRRWWFPEPTQEASPATCARAETRRLLRDAVGVRLRADVEVALALSGGVDSSVIAVECADLGVRPAAFTVSCEGDETDTAYARMVALRLRLPLEVIRVGAGKITGMFRHYDEPFADSSAVAELALAQSLRGRFKVILNGDGGDEAFGGYRHYEQIGIKQWLKRAAAKVGLFDGRGPMDVYLQSKALFRSAERAALLNGNWTGNALDRLPTSSELPGALERAFWSDRHIYLPNDLTYKADIAFGSAGIEGRAPFLDHRLLDWTAKLAPHAHVRGSRKKLLLRAAYRGVLPDEILDRPKHGFGAPVEKWLGGGQVKRPLDEFSRDLLPCPWFERPQQTGLQGQRLWTLLAFAGWAREWGATW
jgi:asparagine synthase (glutamine-hydrolysing)